MQWAGSLSLLTCLQAFCVFLLGNQFTARIHVSFPREKQAVAFLVCTELADNSLGDGRGGPAWPPSAQKEKAKGAIGSSPAEFPLKCGHVWQGSSGTRNR